MSAQPQKFNDLIQFENIQRITMEILHTQHAALSEIVSSPMMPDSALKMKEIAQQSLIKSVSIASQLGGKSNA